MRVITGKAKGRVLKAPRGMNTRPTTDRVKEALFNILGSRVMGARFLDLFAGSGGIGIEALSRGAVWAVFVEKDSKAFQTIKANLATTGLADQAQVIRGDVLQALEFLGREGKVFDLIFLDPPYLQNCEEPVLARVAQLGLLAEKGLVIVESSKRDILPDLIGSLEAFRTEQYGDTRLTFYRSAVQ